MQYSHIFQQIIEDFKVTQNQSLFQPLEGSLVDKIADKDQLKESVILYSHKIKEFRESDLTIRYNSLIVCDQYIELSRTYFELKYTKTRHQDGLYILIIFNAKAKELMIASNQTQFMRIQIFMKRYCMNKNFLAKYQLIEQLNCLSQAQTHKNSETYCLVILEKRTLLTQSDHEIFHNNITIQHSLQLSPQLIKVYEDVNKYYMICQNMKLQSLDNLLQSGFDLKEVPLVSVIFMILQTLQKYYHKSIYHGNISLSTVYFNIQSPTLQIAVLHPRYSKESDHSILDDIKAVGLLLYQITFYNPNQKVPTQIDTELIMISRTMITEDLNYRSVYKYLYRVSQLDLLLQLLDPSITFERAMRHQWFVTIKQNLKMEQRSSIHKASLQTIIEQNESSMSQSQFNEMRNKFKQIMNSNNEIEQIDVWMEPEDENPQREQLVTENPFIMIPSKDKHDKQLKSNFQSKTFTEVSVKRKSILDHLSMNRLPTFQ